MVWKEEDCGPADELRPVDSGEPRVRLVDEEAGGGDAPRLVGAAKVSAVVDGGPELVGQVVGDAVRHPIGLVSGEFGSLEHIQKPLHSSTTQSPKGVGHLNAGLIFEG